MNGGLRGKLARHVPSGVAAHAVCHYGDAVLAVDEDGVLVTAADPSDVRADDGGSEERHGKAPLWRSVQVG